MSVFTPYGPNRRGDTGELEALQTDVMRFLAIIALCLAAIFSLVQSAAVAPASTTLALVDRDSLTQQIDELLQRKRQLVQEVADLQQRLQLTQKGTEQATAALRNTDRSLERLRQQLAALQDELAQSGRRLQRTRAETATQRRTLSALQQQVPTETYRLRQIEQQIPAPAVENTAPRPAPARSNDNTSRGLTLGFASVDALRRLIGSGEVVFYARSGNSFWRLQKLAPPSYGKVKAPRAYYEMLGVTIPPEFIAAFKQTVAGGANRANWGVTLSPAIRRQLERILAQARDGEILIHADGSVEPPPSATFQRN